MIVELHGAGLHLLCSIDHLFRARKDLQVPPLRGLLLMMNGVLSLLHVYLHLQSEGELHQDSKEVLCSLLWEESGCKKYCHRKFINPLVLCGLYREIKMAKLQAINHKIQCPHQISLQSDQYHHKQEVRPAVKIEVHMKSL